jgi:4-amino-4-deoxy-L-arabinose transferase-like glycosyltransferase
VLTPLVGLLVLWRSAHLLFGPRIAHRAVVFALAMPLLAVGGVIITPDTPSVLFWGLAFWALLELQASGNANWWLAVGLAAGLGLLSKYTNLFVGAGMVLWLTMTPANRRWFRAWQLWVGGALAVAIAVPVLVWNANHGWASFTKQFGRVAHTEQFTLRYLGEFIAGYIGLASPAIALLGIVGCLRVTGSAFIERDALRTLLAAAVLPLVAYLCVHALHARVQPNWAAPLYPFLAVCAAVAAGQGWGLRQRSQSRRGVVASAAGIGLSLSLLLLFHAVRPLILLPGTRDPTAQMRGWSQFADEVAAAQHAAGACWIATWSYATTAQLAFALAPDTPVVQLNERLRYVHLPQVEPTLFACPGLLVELERRAFPDALAARFADVRSLATLTRGYAGVRIATYALYRLAAPKGPVLSEEGP